MFLIRDRLPPFRRWSLQLLLHRQRAFHFTCRLPSRLLTSRSLPSCQFLRQARLRTTTQVYATFSLLNDQYCDIGVDQHWNVAELMADVWLRGKLDIFWVSDVLRGAKSAEGKGVQEFSPCDNAVSGTEAEASSTEKIVRDIAQLRNCLLCFQLFVDGDGVGHKARTHSLLLQLVETCVHLPPNCAFFSCVLNVRNRISHFVFFGGKGYRVSSFTVLNVCELSVIHALLGFEYLETDVIEIGDDKREPWHFYGRLFLDTYIVSDNLCPCCLEVRVAFRSIRKVDFVACILTLILDKIMGAHIAQSYSILCQGIAELGQCLRCVFSDGRGVYLKQSLLLYFWSTKCLTKEAGCFVLDKKGIICYDKNIHFACILFDFKGNFHILMHLNAKEDNQHDLILCLHLVNIDHIIVVQDITFVLIITKMSFDSDPEECFLDQLDTPYKEIDISVVDSVPRGSGLSSYIAYFVTMKSPKHFTIQRRYSQFSALREVLVKRWPGVMIPPLPAKHSSGSNSLKVVNERIKYLTYFLNNCVKMNYIFMCDQFQLFLTSTSPNLKRQLEKLLPLPCLLMLNRYQQAFPEVKADENRRGELAVLMRDQVQPFIKQLNSQRIYLINLKRQVFKLAKRRDQYLRTSRVLFCDTLPNLENHLTKTTESVNLVLANNEQVKESITVLKECNAKNYWLLFEALKLEIAESQAMIEALQSRNDLQRQQERLTHEILVNQEELKNIQNKKMTLKQFFSRNNEDLMRQLQQNNKNMRQELQSLKILNLIVAEISTSQLISNFYLRRESLWRQSFSNYLCKQRQFSTFMESFFKLFLK